MKKQEMGKLMLWLLGVFPQWKPDPAVAQVWAQEIPDISANEAMQAVRVVMEKNPSPFPPGVFQIVSALRGRCDPKKEARIYFAEFWNGGDIDNPRAKEALRLAVGKGYGQCLTADKDWHEKRFVEIYEGLTERSAHETQRLLGPERHGSNQGVTLLAEGRQDLEERPGGDEKKGVGVGSKRLEAVRP